MASQVFTNISLLAGVHSPDGFLRGKSLQDLPLISRAYLIVEGDTIAGFGSMENYRGSLNDVTEGTIIIPAWCDSHTHLVYAGSRETEFIDKIKGLTYAEIAAKGGGILNSAQKLNDTSEQDLYIQAGARLQKIARLGTGAVEIKSGYGLSLEGEIKMLRVIKKLQQNSPVKIRRTFLAAHTYPVQFRDDHESYIRMIINEMLPIIVQEDLADYIDVFCENGFFSPAEMTRICAAGVKAGLTPKLHVNQLNSIGGIGAGIACGALSLDHLETLTSNDIDLLGHFSGASTLLPTAALFLRMNMPPARKLINANAAVTLATDYNPGSSPSGNMNLVVSLSCMLMKMLPEEAINAATFNGACAMQLENEYGSIAVGKKANLIFTKPVPSLAYLPYSFGENLVDRVMLHGAFI